MCRRGMGQYLLLWNKRGYCLKSAERFVLEKLESQYSTNLLHSVGFCLIETLISKKKETLNGFPKRKEHPLSFRTHAFGSLKPSYTCHQFSKNKFFYLLFFFIKQDKIRTSESCLWNKQ